MWFAYKPVRFLSTIKMSCKRLLHTKYCGKADDDFNLKEVSAVNDTKLRRELNLLRLLHETSEAFDVRQLKKRLEDTSTSPHVTQRNQINCETVESMTMRENAAAAVGTKSNAN
jgi:hypothetical protein